MLINYNYCLSLLIRWIAGLNFIRFTLLKASPTDDKVVNIEYDTNEYFVFRLLCGKILIV